MDFTRAALLSLFVIMIAGCENQSQKEERMARQYCSVCHAFPDPSLLDKETWKKNVLPEMAFRMGLKTLDQIFAHQDETTLKAGIIPATPMVTEEQWNAIRNYFETHAPDSLPATEILADTTLNQFDVSIVKTSIQPLICLLQVDTLTDDIYVGTRLNALYKFDPEFVHQDSMPVPSPPSHLQFEKNGHATLSVMGIMDPNDSWKGQLLDLNFSGHTAASIIDSLQRPVFAERIDLNNDGLEDYIVCSFGNYTGALLVYENLGRDQYARHILYNLPGARRVVIRDVNRDGLQDILVLMTQGDEQISLLTNAGNFNFRVTTLLRFPPVYGSSYFDVADFNHDGHFDFLCTNGDNADFSMVLKPYHGVRIFLNNGKNEFKESTFLPMHGASQAFAADFDGDGDVDIAAISFFPDFKKHPEQGFIYFENAGNTFIPHTTRITSRGRWLVMDTADIDHDGDTDVLLGALDFDTMVPKNVISLWQREKASILLLKNRGKH